MPMSCNRLVARDMTAGICKPARMINAIWLLGVIIRLSANCNTPNKIKKPKKNVLNSCRLDRPFIVNDLETSVDK